MTVTGGFDPQIDLPNLPAAYQRLTTPSLAQGGQALARGEAAGLPCLPCSPMDSKTFGQIHGNLMMFGGCPYMIIYVYYMSIMCLRILGNVKPVKLSDLRFSSNLPSVGFQESVPFHPGRSHPRGPWLAASSACSASNLHQRGSRWIQDAWSSMK